MTGFTNTPGRIHGSTVKEVVAQILDAPLPTWNGTHTVIKVCNLGCEHEVQEEMEFPELIVFKDFADWNVGYGDTGNWPLAWISQSAEVAGREVCDWTSDEAEALMHLLKARWESLRAAQLATPKWDRLAHLGYVESTFTGGQYDVTPEDDGHVRFTYLNPERRWFVKTNAEFQADIENGRMVPCPDTNNDVLGEYEAVYAGGRRRKVVRLHDDGTRAYVTFPDDRDPNEEGLYALDEIREYRISGEWVRVPAEAC